eukprot:TRINITY_DN29166_c0_g3_i1.p1 TRINITY_DN29166_c0_g3~~TRINITY_DN29166_c0_g3_i1.p1  ORF type:complete len:465 (-),score=66.33 TRINITY_DN29166_c0_g3_i1:31-1425(-)
MSGAKRLRTEVAAAAAPNGDRQQGVSEAALRVCTLNKEIVRRARGELDACVKRAWQARLGLSCEPDFTNLRAYVEHLESLLSRTTESDADSIDHTTIMEAKWLCGCGWHALGGAAEKVAPPLLAVIQDGRSGVSHDDCLSAVMIVIPILQDSSSWPAIVEVGRRTLDFSATGAWPDASVPYVCGLALVKLNQLREALEMFEHAVDTRPGFVQAHIEYDKTATSLRDFEACRRVAEKLVRAGSHWTSCWQRPYHMVTQPALRSTPWHDASQFELARALEDNYCTIKKEFQGLLAGGFNWGRVGDPDCRGNESSTHDADLLSGDGAWLEAVLFGNSESSMEVQMLCSATAALLRKFSEVRDCATMRVGEALFSRLRPGTRIRPHCGPTNMRLTCHLGLEIPQGCWIRCGEETRTWSEGHCLVFDDSFEHAVEHHGASVRSVLLVNFWHPDVEEWRREDLVNAMADA